MDSSAGQQELEVTLEDFLMVLKSAKYGAKLGKRNIAREEVVFGFDGANLIITVTGANYTIPATGSWEGKVTIALPFIKGLRRAPPSIHPLVISYANSRLKIGTTSFPAKWTPWY